MKINEIEKRIGEANEKLVQARRSKAEALKMCEKYSQEAEEAAVAGDVDKYLELEALSNKQKAIAHICDKHIAQLSNTNAVTSDEVYAAWNDYMKSYSKEIKTMIKDFQEDKEKLLKKYVQMVDRQNEALKVRERLGSYIGKTRKPGVRDGGLGAFIMESIPCAVQTSTNIALPGIKGSPVNDPDAVYYLSSLKRTVNDALFEKDSEYAKIRDVVLWRVSSTK